MICGCHEAVVTDGTLCDSCREKFLDQQMKQVRLYAYEQFSQMFDERDYPIS